MEHYSIQEDIDLVYLISPNFPKEVPATYERLHSLLPDSPNRRYFGISHPDKTGTIQYMAGAEVLPNEVLDYPELKQFIITKNDFVSIYIVNHFQDSNAIGAAFQTLLKHPDIDPQGYCLEIYKNYTDLDVHCMVPLRK